MKFIDNVTGDIVGCSGALTYTRGDIISFRTSRKVHGTPAHDEYRVVGKHGDVYYVAPVEAEPVRYKTTMKAIPDTLYSNIYWFGYRLSEGSQFSVIPVGSEAEVDALLAEYRATGQIRLATIATTTATLQVQYAVKLHASEGLRMVPGIVEDKCCHAPNVQTFNNEHVKGTHVCMECGRVL